MLTIEFWIWVGAAVVLAVAEIFTGGFFMLPFAVGALVGAIIAALGASLAWQIIGFAATTAIAFIVARMYLVSHNAAPTQPVGGNRLIGKTGLVVREIDAVTDSGIVRVNREKWRAESSTGDAIAEGERIVVTAVEGAHLVVSPVSEPGSEIMAEDQAGGTVS